jgi:hypothetical protein
MNAPPLSPTPPLTSWPADALPLPPVGGSSLESSIPPASSPRPAGAPARAVSPEAASPEAASPEAASPEAEPSLVESRPTPVRWGPPRIANPVALVPLAPARTVALDAAALAFHLTLRLEDDRAIARDSHERRVVARVLLQRAAAVRLLGFFVADTHVHVLVACDRRRAGSFAQAVEAALHARLGLAVRFEAARVRRVNDQGHLTSSFRYVLRQHLRHGLPPHIVVDASSAADVCGLRAVDRDMPGRLLGFLPRLDLDPATTGIDRAAIDASPPLLADLADAAAAVLALPDLEGADPERVALRHAAVHAARRLGIRPADLEHALSLHPRSILRLRSTAADPRLVAGIERQLRLRGHAAQHMVQP